MIVHASWEHTLRVALNMRQDDYEEVMATRWNDSPFEFAADCMRLPGAKLAALDRSGAAVAIGGVALHQPGVGQAWMVGTDGIGAMGIEIAHVCRRVVRQLFLDGVIHRVQAHSIASHTRAHRWMRAIGMKEEAAVPAFGKRGESFIVFSMLKGM